jgi:hypothetical protein
LYPAHHREVYVEVGLKKKYCHNPGWKRRRRSTATIQSGKKEEEEVLPQSRVEKNKDKHLHDMIQNYSSGEISHEQYI